MCNHQLNELIKIMNDIEVKYRKTMTQPTKVKVNENWLQKQLDDELIVKTEGKPMNSFVGIPIKIDNSIDTFELVYHDPYLEHLEKMKEEVFKVFGVPKEYLK
jgi:hypothetical protein